MAVFDFVTSKHAQPVLLFDAEKPVQEERAIQEWANKMFRGTRRLVLYAFLAKGVEIPEPSFVQPGSRPCLELADFVSYIVARHHLKLWKGENPDLPTEKLGKVIYLGLDESHNMIETKSVGFPSDKIMV